jgi:hypothetical protein
MVDCGMGIILSAPTGVKVIALKTKWICKMMSKLCGKFCQEKEQDIHCKKGFSSGVKTIQKTTFLRLKMVSMTC